MSGVDLIAAERQRQIEQEGWTPEHDDEHTDGELADAAAVYAATPRGPLSDDLRERLWPWGEEWYKPTPYARVRDLVKAGALIAAEIDRLQRQSGSPEATG